MSERVERAVELERRGGVWQLARMELGAGGEPVSEFLLIPFGEVSVERPVSGGSFVFERPHAEAAVRWFEQLGRKLAIDYEHQSVSRRAARGDGLRPAAGWIGGLEIRADGLWAVDVSWTPRAAELLRSGEYRYFSPVIYWTDEDCSGLAALGPVALTNDPAMHGVQALAASRSASVSDEDDDANAEQVAGLRRELEAARMRVAALSREVLAHQAEAFIERGMRAGKIVESTREDWREDFLLDASRAEMRLERAPVLLPPGRVIELDGTGGVRPLRAAREPQRDGAAIEAEDLEAYERAVLAGRVRVLARGA